MGNPMPARRAALTATLAAAVSGAVALGALSAAPASRAAGFDPAETWAWSSPEQLLASGTARAARLEPLPGGRLAALLVVDGDAHGNATGDVLVSRVRETSGTWGAPQVVGLGAEPVALRTFDSFADSAGRIVVVWAVKNAPVGQYAVRSVARSGAGAWGGTQELYTTQTIDYSNDSIEVGGIAPRLVPFGDTVTLAWATVANAPSSRTDVDTEPFRARRWTAGAWGPEVRSDGYGDEAVDVKPLVPDQVTVWADPVRAARSSDGRISFVYSLRKQRVVHSMSHPLSDQTGPNVAQLWDGIAERPWDAITNTAWVVHLDPGQGWSAPAKLVTDGGPPVVCASPTLPSNPPLVDHWAEWKAYSINPGIRTSCPGEESRPRSATYDDDGRLQIQLDYQSDPSSEVVLNQFLDKACDDPSASNSTRFCFDDWGSTDWGIDWPSAGISIAPDASRPAPAAVHEGPPPVDRSTRVSTTSGPVTVHEQADGGNAILFDRTGSDVVWRPDEGDTTPLRVSHVFAHGDDVAVFFWRGTQTSTPGCGMAVLRDGGVTGPSLGCLAASTAHLEDVVQLADGRLAWIDGDQTGSPVRLYAPTTPSPTPTPTPTPTTFTATEQPRVTGRLRVGRTLTARPGTWVPVPSAVGYRWYAGTKAIPRATRARLRLTQKLVGKRIKVRITLTRQGVTTTTRTVRVPGRVR